MGNLISLLLKGRRYFCECMLDDGGTVYLVMRAWSEAEASKKIHESYAIEYVLDILTPAQMKQRKQYLRKAYLTSSSAS